VNNTPAPLERQSHTRESRHRVAVLWVGARPPDLLMAACLQNGLTLKAVEPAAIALEAPQARALAIEVPADAHGFVPLARQMISESLGHGLAVALVHHDGSGVPEMRREAIEHYFDVIKEVRQDDVRVSALYGDWSALARWAGSHQPGPGASAHLSLSGEVPADPAAQLLLRRAFHDFDAVMLDSLAGGKSGASVLLVRPGARDRRPRPFVVKIHSQEKMKREQSNCAMVRDAVGPRLHAPLYEDRCVRGDALALVVYDVVDRALPFRSIVPSNTSPLIASAIGETLQGFRARGRSVTRNIGSEFGADKLKALRWSEDLRGAARRARELRREVLEPEALAAQIRDLPPITFLEAIVHGDLHAGNLFVPASSTDVLMIDFGSVRPDGPAVADPACLEVSLTFPPADDSSPGVLRAPLDWRRGAYVYPLHPRHVPVLSGGGSWLETAVRQIRTQVRQFDESHIPYCVAVAAYLIRFASYADNGPEEERAVAYEIANDLIVGAAKNAATTQRAEFGDAR
jgi:hypothetical protein